MNMIILTINKFSPPTQIKNIILGPYYLLNSFQVPIIYLTFLSYPLISFWTSISLEHFLFLFLFFYFGEGSSRLCLDYILGNLEIKFGPSETKPGHKMCTPGLEPGWMGYSTTSPQVFCQYATTLVVNYLISSLLSARNQNYGYISNRHHLYVEIIKKKKKLT